MTYDKNTEKMLKATIKFEDEKGQVIEKAIEYKNKDLDLGTFSNIEILLEDFKQLSFPPLEGGLITSKKKHFTTPLY